MNKLSLLILMLSIFTAAHSQQYVLVKKGKPKSCIIIPEKPSPIEVQSAMVLRDYIERISGAVIPVLADSVKSKNYEILIGNVNRETLKGEETAKLGENGLLIRTSNKNLLISGGSEKGVLYGVYTFLEKYLGCRKYTSTYTYVPEKKTIVIGPINDTELPSFSYRENHYRDGSDPQYMEWHKLDSHGERGDNTSKWGTWVHTFGSLLSPVEYGQSHPEYFSYYDSTRHAGIEPSWDGKSIQPESQLCLSNPDVLEIVCKNLKAQMDKNPDAIYWSVSQNDNVNYCRCPECAATDLKYASFEPGTKWYGTHANSMYSPIGSGSIINFVNKVAERFPDKIISTLAYQYSRVPPKDIVPAKNVNIMLCDIESPRHIPIQKGDTAFSSDLEGWGKLTNNIIVWDYIIQFSNLISPFPNLYTLKPNIQFFYKNRVSALFEQGNREIGGEFSELRAYLVSKLMWDQNADVDWLINDFLTGYYGKASDEIKEYIDITHNNKMAQAGFKLSIFGSPQLEKDIFLTDSLLNAVNAIFDRAEKNVSDSPVILDHVRSARLPVYFSTLQIARFEKTGPRGAFIMSEDNSLKPDPDIVKTLYSFVYQCVKTNVTRVTEWHTTPKEYLANYLQYLQDPTGTPEIGD
jgi:hypothetical protein